MYARTRPAGDMTENHMAKGNRGNCAPLMALAGMVSGPTWPKTGGPRINKKTLLGPGKSGTGAPGGKIFGAGETPRGDLGTLWGKTGGKYPWGAGKK